MKNFKFFTAPRLALFLLAGILMVGLTWSMAGAAQDKAAATDKGLAGQIADLNAKVAKLEAALAKNQPDKAAGMSGMPDMGGMGKKKDDKMMGGMGDKKKSMSGGMDPMDSMKPDEMMGQMMQKMGQMMQMMGGMKAGGGMGMMDMDMMGSGKKSMGGMSGMAMEDDDMEMMGMMGKGSMSQGGMKGMKGMSKMQQTAALPGFPGASHIYHVGTTGFFLNHSEHITLTTEQQAKLNRAKEKSLLEKSKAQRKIDDAEQELWELTGADEPDAKQIQAKIQGIEKARSDQRLAFIRSVGEAANVLTGEQRQVLLGNAKSDAHKAHQPPAK